MKLTVRESALKNKDTKTEGVLNEHLNFISKNLTVLYGLESYKISKKSWTCLKEPRWSLDEL